MQNEGFSASQYRGDVPVTDVNYLAKYLTNNFCIKEGMITEIYAGGYLAQVNYGIGIGEAVWLTDLLGGLSGTKNFSIPSIGTKVLIFAPYTGPHIILGSLPTQNIKEGILHNVQETEVDYTNQDQHNILTSRPERLGYFFNNDRPLDALPGDLGWINEFGNVISLLRGVVIIKGCSTAQIQLHAFDQLLRFISCNYEHLSAGFKDVAYTSNQKHSREIDIYTTKSESLGTDGSIVEDTEGKVLELKKDLKPKPRLKVHTGALGNLLRLFAKNETDSEHFDLSIDKDGYLVVRTTNGIKFQQKTKMYFPERTKEYYKEEQGTSSEEGAKTKFMYDENHSKTSQEDDKENWDYNTYSKQNYKEEYWERIEIKPENNSIIHQRKDGSVVIKDKAGSFIEFDGEGNINISCSGNVIIKNGGDLAALSKDITLRSQNNLEACCTLGDINLKAEEGLRLFARNKPMILESESSENPAIKIKSLDKAASVFVEAGRNLVLWSNRNTVIKTEKELRLDSSVFTSSCRQKVEDIKYNYNLSTNKVEYNTDHYFVKFKSLKMSGDHFRISGRRAGKIHGGPHGTDINHRHSKGRDELTYVRDCRFGGEKLIRIIRNNAHTPVSAHSPDLVSVESLMDSPKSELDRESFKFSYDTFDKKMYEDEWQAEAMTTWDLLSKNDIFNYRGTSTSPFPGTEFKDYYTYKSSGGTKKEPGNFTKKTIKQFRI